MAASLLVMSKVRAERHLSLQPHLEMHKKAFLERVMLVAAYLPIFGLAAIFRIGSLAMIFASVPTAPESVMSFLYFNVAFFVYGSLTLSSCSSCLDLGPPSTSSPLSRPAKELSVSTPKTFTPSLYHGMV